MVTCQGRCYDSSDITAAVPALFFISLPIGISPAALLSLPPPSRWPRWVCSWPPSSFFSVSFCCPPVISLTFPLTAGGASPLLFDRWLHGMVRCKDLLAVCQFIPAGGVLDGCDVGWCVLNGGCIVQTALLELCHQCGHGATCLHLFGLVSGVLLCQSRWRWWQWRSGLLRRFRWVLG